MDAAHEIRKFLAAKGSPSSRELCRRAKVSHSYLYGVLRGRHRPTYEPAERLARLIFPADTGRQSRFILALLSAETAPA